MTFDRLGQQRAEAIWRIIFGVIFIGTAFVVPGILLVIGVAAAVIYHVVDVILQFFLDSGLSSDGLWGMLGDLYHWPLGMFEWWFFGGDFPWTPSEM